MDNPLTSGAGASAHGRLVDFAIGLATNDYDSYKCYYRGREGDGSVNFRRDGTGFFTYDATQDSEYKPITKEEADEVKKILSEKRQDKGKIRIDRLFDKLPNLKGKKLSELEAYGLVLTDIDGKKFLRTREGF